MKKRRKIEAPHVGGYGVANQAETTITLTDGPDDGERAVITEGLRAYDGPQARGSDSRALAILVSPEPFGLV
jgi:hypothetical protein